MNDKEFIRFVKDHCKTNDFDLVIGDRYVVIPGTEFKCNGFFDDGQETPILAFAANAPEALSVLVHEYCHSLQSLEDPELWSELEPTDEEIDLYGEDLSLDLVFSWIEGAVEPKKKHLKRQLHRDIRIELDCEKRAVQKIKELGLDIDIPRYVQRANSYVYFYQMMFKHKRWYDIGREPYNTPEVYEIMPADFSLNYLKPVTQKYEKLYIKHCF